MRIACGGIHIERSTRSPVLNRETDFRVRCGVEMTEAPYFAFLKEMFLPMIHVRSIAGGAVAREVCETFKADAVAPSAGRLAWHRKARPVRPWDADFAFAPQVIRSVRT